MTPSGDAPKNGCVSDKIKPDLCTFWPVSFSTAWMILDFDLQYSIFIKSPYSGSSDLIYKFGKGTKKKKRLIYKSNY